MEELHMASDVGKQAAALIAVICDAVGDISKPADTDVHTAESGPSPDRLLAAVRRRLAKSHPSLLDVKITKRPCRKRSLEAYEMSGRPQSTRVWRPSRPALSMEIARLIKDSATLVTVPAEKRCVCAFPFKFFVRDIAKAVTACDASIGFSSRSIQFAATETMSAIVSEAESVAKEGEGVFELHASTDAAWAGRTARGSGIAMDEAGKAVVIAAASRVAEHLAERSAQPELTLTPHKAELFCAA
jgi:hypothetical protein